MLLTFNQTIVGSSPTGNIRVENTLELGISDFVTSQGGGELYAT